MIADLHGKEYKFQCKVRKKISKDVLPDINHVDAQLIKQDYGQTFIVMPLTEFINELKRVKEMDNGE
tara:strand:- start:82 stop:282 length:201 start_codon:yes stop_codon:yes gene_type:complete